MSDVIIVKERAEALVIAQAVAASKVAEEKARAKKEARDRKAAPPSPNASLLRLLPPTPKHIPLPSTPENKHSLPSPASPPHDSSTDEITNRVAALIFSKEGEPEGENIADHSPRSGDEDEYRRE